MLCLILMLAASVPASPRYDLLLKGGHVIDAKNGINAARDVAIRNGRIAAVAVDIPSSDAGKTVDVSGLYVTPGLVDIHAHVFAGTMNR
ncbi:MAG: amidohydrolase/deacetylase family metallohydrolase, partial [Acidobacteria bacterium]|nr:amidohydrolase/deacetylase family metallohydrolase [Acidobacteriota bacterium]